MEVFILKPNAFQFSASIAWAMLIVENTIAADVDVKVDFSKDIRPSLSDRCFYFTDRRITCRNNLKQQGLA